VTFEDKVDGDEKDKGTPEGGEVAEPFLGVVVDDGDGAGAEEGGEEAGAKYVDAEAFIGEHHKEVMQGGLVGAEGVVVGGEKPVVALEHFHGAGAIAGFVNYKYGVSPGVE